MGLKNKGKELLEKVNGRGWNLYDSTNTNGNPADADGIIRKGPVNELEVGRRYVLMPAANKPRSPVQVFAALERVALALDRQMPTITTSDGRFPLTGIRVINSGTIKVNTPDGE